MVVAGDLPGARAVGATANAIVAGGETLIWASACTQDNASPWVTWVIDVIELNSAAAALAPGRNLE